eukprot:scaffold31709_cov41-Cyclotella_meneghiniana.AAC.9
MFPAATRQSASVLLVKKRFTKFCRQTGAELASNTKTRRTWDYLSALVTDVISPRLGCGC